MVTLLLAAVGFLSPASRGALLTSAIVLYLLLAITAGFCAVLLWGNVQRSYTGWTGICLKTACYFPGVALDLNTVLHRPVFSGQGRFDVAIRRTDCELALCFTLCQV